MSYPEPIDLSGLKTYSLYDRPGKVTVSDFARPVSSGLTLKDFLKLLPSQLAAKDFKNVVQAI